MFSLKEVKMINRRGVILGAVGSTIATFATPLVADAALSSAGTGVGKGVKAVGTPRIASGKLATGMAPVRLTSSASAILPKIQRVELIEGSNKSRVVRQSMLALVSPIYSRSASVRGQILEVVTFADGSYGVVALYVTKAGERRFEYSLVVDGAIARGYPKTLWASKAKYWLRAALPIGGDRFVYSLVYDDFGNQKSDELIALEVTRIVDRAGATQVSDLDITDFADIGPYMILTPVRLSNRNVALGVCSPVEIGEMGKMQFAQMDRQGAIADKVTIDGAKGQLSVDATFGIFAKGRKFCIGSAMVAETINGSAQLHNRLVGAIQQNDGTWAYLDVPESPRVAGYAFQARPIAGGRLLAVWGSTLDVHDDGSDYRYSLTAGVWNADGCLYCQPRKIANLNHIGLVDDLTGSASHGFVISGRIARKTYETDSAGDAFALPLVVT